MNNRTFALLLLATSAISSHAKRATLPTEIVMVDEAGTKMKRIDGRDVYVFEEKRNFAAEDSLHGIVHFDEKTTSSFASFLEVGEGDPAAENAQNLAPGALQCYCQFKKAQIETLRFSEFNNAAADEDAFLEEKVKISRSSESKPKFRSAGRHLNTLEPKESVIEEAARRRNVRPKEAAGADTETEERNPYSDSTFDQYFEDERFKRNDRD
eukprot:g1010.t1